MRTNSHPRLRAALIAVACAVLSAHLFAQKPLPVAESCTANYVIGPEDVLDVAVWESTAVARVVPVRPDGKISLPLVNDVQAAGLTPMQLRENLAKALTPFIPDPNVSVLVREIHSFKVTVIGQVKTPGRYEIKDRATALDVLALAGGVNEYADRARIVILRQDNPTPRPIPFPYDKLTAKKVAKSDHVDGQSNPCLKPGDVILVP